MSVILFALLFKICGGGVGFMEIRAAAARKKSENRMEEIENCMASLQYELNQFGSWIDRLNQLDVEKLNSAIYRLPKVEENVLMLVR